MSDKPLLDEIRAEQEQCAKAAIETADRRRQLAAFAMTCSAAMLSALEATAGWNR